MPFYRPHMHAVLDAQIALGSQEMIAIPMRVRRAMLEKNDHTKADQLELEAEWSDVGIDPRFIRDANVTFYLADVPSTGRLDPNKSLRFVGVVHAIERHGSEQGVGVSIKAQDFTALFLQAKNFPAEGVPSFPDTLSTAWEKVCDHTGIRSLQTRKIVSTVERLRKRIKFRGGAEDVPIGRGVPPRFAKQGRIVVKDKADAWSVWLQCVGMLGLVTWIELDEVIVSTTVDLFDQEATPERRPRMIWGKNILEFKETAHGGRESAKGVGLTSYDPTTGRTIEAVYPDPNDLAILAKRPTAKKKKSAATAVVAADDYDWQAYPGVTDPEELRKVAGKMFDERSHQEVEGSFTTAEMRVESENGEDFDLLTLSSGDAVQVEIDTSIDRGAFSSMPEGDRVAYLVARGYEEAIAKVLARNAKRLLQHGVVFHAKDVRVMLESSGDGGTFSVEVTFWNRYELDDVGSRGREGRLQG